MEILQILGILRERGWLVALGLIIGLMGGAALYEGSDPMFVGTAQVVIDTRHPDPVSGVAEGAQPGSLSTQLEILTSDRVAERVVHILRLDQSPSVIKVWRDQDRKGEVPFNAWLIKWLEKCISAQPERDSNVIALNFTAFDAEFAQAGANAFAQAFVEVSVEMKVEPARQYAALFEEQAKQARERVLAAENRLHAYERERGVIASSDKLEIETSKLNDLQTSLVAAESTSLEVRSRSANAGDSSPDVMSNGVVQGLRTEIDRAEAKLAELSSKVGKSNPNYISAQTEVATLKEKLAQETHNVTTSVNTIGQVNAGKVAGLRAAVAAQRQKIFDTRKSLSDFGVLQQEVEAAQKFYDAVNSRYTQSTLESRANQTNIYLLTPATKPYEASFPKLQKLLMTFGGAGLGAALVIVAALELLDRRIRAISELTNGLNVHFLGELSPPRYRSPLERWLSRFTKKSSATTPQPS